LQDAIFIADAGAAAKISAAIAAALTTLEIIVRSSNDIGIIADNEEPSRPAKVPLKVLGLRLGGYRQI
jgi:hypothetical protein